MSRRSLVRTGSTVDAEVANLFKIQNKSQFSNALLHLRQRYRDEDLVNKIQEVFMAKHAQIVKSAKKFAMAVRNKYASQNVPFHQLLMKARAHAKKHNLSEAEFAEFQRIYEQELSGSGSNEVVIPMTNIMKVLGNITNETDNYFNVNEADYRNLQEILKLNDMSRPLHAQVLLQAIQYEGLDQIIALSMSFDKNINNPVDHVHPVIAALFLPRIKTIDEHFLFSNMSGIVKSRYNRQALTTRPDYELFYNLVTDPNDVVCDISTPVADLLHRCNLQNQLWNSVLHLRNGQLYSPSLREFTASVDVCRLNKYDNPDFVYGRHDGTILKRLFSAFSFRPTMVATIPIANLFAYNPYSQNIRPTITSIPMINVRLSSFGSNAAAAANAIGRRPTTFNNKLSETLTQTNDFLEGNSIINRHTSVMYSREVLVFYIDRRSYAFTAVNTLTNLARLPTSIAGFERINNISLTYESYIDIVGTKDRFKLASAVVADVNDEVDPGSNVMVGSNTILFPEAFSKNSIIPGATSIVTEPLVYSPGTVISRTNETKNKPIYIIDLETAKETVSKKGIIFVYVNINHKEINTLVLN
jgi:hypothetical protein